MSDRIAYAAVWALCSVLLLALGFLAMVALGAAIAARGDPAHAAQTLTAFGVYTRVVLAKGLLPALAVALVVWAWLGRGGQLAQRGWPTRMLAMLAAAALGSAVAAGVLLPLALPGLPPVRYSGTPNFLRTCAEMALPVALAAWLPELVLARLRQRAPLLLAGLLVVFLAGGASIARLARRAPEPPPPAAAAPPEVSPPSPATPPREPAPATGAIPVSALPLQLLATSVDAEPAKSVAFVADTERTAPQLMREGDTFEFHPEVRLAHIEARRALIDNQGRTEMLELNPDASLFRDLPETHDDLSREEIESRREAAQRIRKWMDEGSGAARMAIVGGLLAEGDPVPVYEDGVITGVELQNIRPDGLYARMGLRDGDRVGAINGVAVGAPDAGGALVRALTEAPEIELSVERSDGTPAQIKVPRTELLDELRALEWR